MTYMQWQGKNTNFSTNQKRWIDHCNISWNSGNWIYEFQQNHIRTYTINFKFTVRYNRRESKETQNWEKEVNRIKLQKRHWKVNNKNEWQRKMSVWSFKLVDRTSNYRFGIELSKQQFCDSIRLEFSGNKGNRYFLTFPGMMIITKQISFSLNCKLMTAAAYNLQRISKM